MDQLPRLNRFLALRALGLSLGQIATMLRESASAAAIWRFIARALFLQQTTPV